MTIEDKIQLNLKGLNLVYDNGPREVIMEIAAPIMSEYHYQELGKYNNYRSSLSWSHNLERLLAQEHQFSDEQWRTLIAAIKDDIIRMHQILFFLSHLTKTGKIDLAKEVIEDLKGIDMTGRVNEARALGHRVVLNYYAEQGDIVKFEETLKRCEIVRERYAITQSRSILLRSLHKLHPIDKVYEIYKKKFSKIGAYAPLIEFARKMPFDDFITFLDKVKNELAPYEYELLYVNAYKAHPIEAAAQFQKTFDMIGAIDPKHKFGDVKLRDWLLMELGSSTSDLALVKKCKKQIKSSRIKKELGYHEARLPG